MTKQRVIRPHVLPYALMQCRARVLHHPNLNDSSLVVFYALQWEKKKKQNTVALHLAPVWQLGVNYLPDSVRVKQTDRRARHQLL